MHCRKCGKSIEEGVSFCMYCGTAVQQPYGGRSLNVQRFDDEDETVTHIVPRPLAAQETFRQVPPQYGGMPPQTPPPYGGAPQQTPPPYGGAPQQTPPPYGGAPQQTPPPYGGVPQQTPPQQAMPETSVLQTPPAGMVQQGMNVAADQSEYEKTSRLTQADMPDSLRQQPEGTGIMPPRTESLKSSGKKISSQNKGVVSQMDQKVRSMTAPPKKPVNKKKLIMILSSVLAVLLMAGAAAYWFFVVRADKKFNSIAVNSQIYSSSQEAGLPPAAFSEGSAASLTEGDVPSIIIRGKNEKTVSLPGEITAVYYAGAPAIVDGSVYVRMVCDDSKGTEAVIVKVDMGKGKSEILQRTTLSGDIEFSSCRYLSLFYARPDGLYILNPAASGFDVQKIDWLGKKDGKVIGTIGSLFLPGIRGDKLIASDVTGSRVISFSLKNGKEEELFPVSALPEELGSIASIYETSAGMHYVWNDRDELYRVEGTTAPSVTKVASAGELSFRSEDGSVTILTYPVLLTDEKDYYIPYGYSGSASGGLQPGVIRLDAERGSLGAEALFSESGFIGLQAVDGTLRILSDASYQKETILDSMSQTALLSARGSMTSDLTDYCNGKITRSNLDTALNEQKASDYAGYSYVKEAADLLQESVESYNKEGYLTAYNKAKEGIAVGLERGNLFTEACGTLIMTNCLGSGLRYYEDLAEEAYQEGNLEDFISKIKALEALYAEDPATLESIAEFAEKHDFTIGTKAEDRAAYWKFITEKILQKDTAQLQEDQVVYTEADGAFHVHCYYFALADFDGDGHEELFLYSWREAADGSGENCGEAAIYDVDGGNVTKTVYGRSNHMSPVYLDYYEGGTLLVSTFNDNGYADMYIGADAGRSGMLGLPEGNVFCISHNRDHDTYNMWVEGYNSVSEGDELEREEYGELEKVIRSGERQTAELFIFNQTQLEKELGEQ